MLEQFGVISFSVLVAHTLADFPLQTDQMANEKFRDVRTRLLHSCVHLILTALFLLPLVSVVSVLSTAVLIFISHYTIDTQRWAEPKSGFENYPIFVDQAYHLFSIYIVSLIVVSV